MQDLKEDNIYQKENHWEIKPSKESPQKGKPKDQITIRKAKATWTVYLIVEGCNNTYSSPTPNTTSSKVRYQET
jgi:hypothetical protein